MRGPGVVNAQRRNASAVEGDYRWPEKLDLWGSGAHGPLEETFLALTQEKAPQQENPAFK